MTKERVTVDFDEQSYYLDGEYWESWDNYGEEMADAINKLLNELVEENEQLKKENYELHKRLGDFEPFERYMKERTSKTSLEDIIGIVKTDEPTNSVELKKELYK